MFLFTLNAGQTVSPVFVILLLALTAQARADVYVYTDADKVEHYTNTPGHDHYERLSALMEVEGVRNRAGAAVVKGNAAVYAPQIEQAAGEAGIDAALVHAVITAESGYNPAALSRTGAQGLMQLMPDTAKRYAVKDAFDPEQNIRGGTRYLRDLLDMFDNNLKLAVAAYNAGENAVLRHGRKIPPYRETQAYVPKVLRLYDKYRALL
jgi:soluble lytic murein transglycosylase-like protein